MRNSHLRLLICGLGGGGGKNYQQIDNVQKQSDALFPLRTPIHTDLSNNGYLYVTAVE